MSQSHSSHLTVAPENEWVASCKTALLGLGMAIACHTLVAEVRYIPSGSMLPTIQIGDRVIVEKLSYRFRQPQRGEVVVFKAPPRLQALNLGGDYIKRIIGLPNDVVQVQSGRVLINGAVIAESYLQAAANYSYGPIRVPANHYFVLGDNRNQSYDSHLWGFVPSQNIVGTAWLRFYPLPRFGHL